MEDLSVWGYAPEAVEPDVEREERALYRLAPASDWDPLKLECDCLSREPAMDAGSADWYGSVLQVFWNQGDGTDIFADNLF